MFLGSIVFKRQFQFSFNAKPKTGQARRGTKAIMELRTLKAARQHQDKEEFELSPFATQKQFKVVFRRMTIEFTRERQESQMFFPKRQRDVERNIWFCKKLQEKRRSQETAIQMPK